MELNNLLWKKGINYLANAKNKLLSEIDIKRGLGISTLLFGVLFQNDVLMRPSYSYKDVSYRPHLVSSHEVAKLEINQHSKKNADVNIEELLHQRGYEILSDNNESSGMIDYVLIDKNRQVASIYKIEMKLEGEFFVSTGLNEGDKKLMGDKKTPNGLFKIVSVENSKSWIHDGKVGSYGNTFSRLDAGQWSGNGKFNAFAKSSIGIHGTNEPGKIGYRASDGCIRFNNTVNDYLVNSGVLKFGTYVKIIGS